MTRARKSALCVTAILVVVLFIWLRFAHIFISQKVAWPPQNTSEIVVDDEMFFDVVEDIPFQNQSNDDPAKVFNEVDADNMSVPAAASGDALQNQGAAGAPPVPVSSKNPSPVKTPATQPQKTGPSKEEIEEAEARRRADAAISSAFSNSTGSDNTANQASKPGDSGSPSGSASGFNGTGTGSVGGGWSMPKYGRVPSTVTGSIRVMARIDASGNVVSVSFLGGDAPAATDKALRAAVEAEVKSKKFSRGNSPAPEQATAYITYRFR